MNIPVWSRRSFLFLLVLAGFRSAAQDEHTDWMREATLIFKGEVVVPHSSTVDYPDPDDLAVVQVTEIIEGREVLQPFLNKPITVRFRDADKIRKGFRAVFYTQLWISGESIAVTEVGTDAGAFDDPQLPKQVAAGRARLQDDTLVQVLRQAELVVSGRVVAVRRMTDQSPKESEHDPQWMLADVRVDETMKGAGIKTVTFAFPASTDIMWYRVPKFKVAQAGIWLLSRESAGFADPKRPVIVRPDQFQPVSQKTRIRQLLAR